MVYQALDYNLPDDEECSMSTDLEAVIQKMTLAGKNIIKYHAVLLLHRLRIIYGKTSDNINWINQPVKHCFKIYDRF